MAMVIAGIAVIARYVALAGVWRYAREDREPATGSFWRALRDTFSNAQFLAFLPSFVLFQLALHLLTAVLPFYVETILGDSRIFGFTVGEHTGIFTFALTVAVIGGMLASVPFFGRWARQAGKARVYRAAMVGAAAYFPLLFFIGLLAGVPAIVQAVIAIFLAGVPTAGVFLFPAIITADIVDDDATRTQTRREAMFYGAQNQLEKAATALAPLLFALILLIGDTAEHPLGIRLVGPVAGLLVLAGYLAFRPYSLERGTARLPL
jgi:GPH family glycoside/pentoside/hexuronide:cation symporter